VFGPVIKGIAVAASPKGRRAIGAAIRFARSEEGRKAMSQAQKVATGPQARKIGSQVVRSARQVGEVANRPENQERIKAVVGAVRRRKR
jgi:hypothetical protein